MNSANELGAAAQSVRQRTVKVEFFGIPRQRAGVAETVVELSASSVQLGDLLNRLAIAFPQFGKDCIAQNRLTRSLTANLDGKQFIRDPAALIHAGQSVLIMSADAGG